MPTSWYVQEAGGWPHLRTAMSSRTSQELAGLQQDCSGPVS